MASDDLNLADIISRDRTAGPPGSSRWRRPLLFSLLAHVTLGLGWWAYCLWSFVPVPVAADGIKDNRVPEVEEEYDVAVMDVDVPLVRPRPAKAVPPTVDPPEPVAITTPSVQPPGPVSSGHSPGGTVAESVPGSTLPAGPVGPVAGTGGTSGPTTTFFEVPAQGRSVVYVIDRSCSMGSGGQLDRARREVLTSLARLPESVRFQIIAYNRRPESPRVGARTELLPATQENKDRAAQFLRALVAEGGTEHFPALDLALRLKPDVIYFLTDADDLKPEEVRALTQINAGRSAIHAIELNTSNQGRPNMPMQALTGQNHGHYQAVDLLKLR